MFSRSVGWETLLHQVMCFIGPRQIGIIERASAELGPDQVRVRTIASGVSAGTELTAYRGTNPYLTSTWNADLHLFTDAHPDQPRYPLEGWGYSEVGVVTEVRVDAPIDDADVRLGDVVWGIWGHRSEAVLPRAALHGHRLPDGMDPLTGCFVRVGAIALNAVLAAQCGIGDRVAIFGQGVIGLLATHFALRSGASVIAVDGIDRRRDRALAAGASAALSPGGDTALDIRRLTDGRGADVAIDLSGSYHALSEAIRAVGPDSTVVAAGFYQGPAEALALGEEFHHNRVRIVASQIGAVPPHLYPRWDRDRLQHTVVGALADKHPDVLGLISHRFALADADQAFQLLDQHPEQAMQVLLDFTS